MCRIKSILIEDLFKLNVQLDLQVFDEDFDHWVNIDQSYKPDDKEKTTCYRGYYVFVSFFQICFG